MHRSVRATLTATLFAVAISPAHAADITPEQAKALEGQVRSWAQGLLGPDIRLADRPVQVTSEGDHYHLAVPIKVKRGFTPGEIVLTGSARPASDGRWTIEDMRFPSPSSFTVQVLPPFRTGQTTLEPPIPLDYTITAGNQETQGTYDPSLTTPSTLTTSVQNLDITAVSALIEQTTKVRRLAGANTLRPSGTDRVDLIVDNTMEGYAGSSEIDGNQKIGFTAEKMRVVGQITAVSRDRVAQIISMLVRLTGSAAPTGTSLIDTRLLRILVQSLQDFATELTMDETIDGAAMLYGPYKYTASQLRIGMGVKADAGLLQAHMDFDFDDLVWPDLPPGMTVALLPRRLALRPVFSGVRIQHLLQLLEERNPNDADRPSEIFALFNRLGVSAGLESFAVDIGNTSFVGMGNMTTATPKRLTGQAQVTATNFDDFIQRASNAPELASVLPAFVFAKGVGRVVGNQVMWDFTYRDNKLLVNGIDLLAMAGGGSRWPPGQSRP